MSIFLLAILLLGVLLIWELISEDPPRVLITSYAILLLGTFFMLEMVWIGFVAFWAVRLSLRWFPRWGLALPLSAGVLIIACHFNGWKMYGVPVLHENHSLIEQALELDHLELPNILVATNGTRHELKGVQFIPEIATVPREQLSWIFDYRSERKPICFAPGDLSSYPSGYVGEQRIRYSCGNSWFPSFFPRPLDSHQNADVGLILRRLTVENYLATK